MPGTAVGAGVGDADVAGPAQAARFGGEPFVAGHYAAAVPTDLALKAMNGVHRLVIKASGGRLGLDVGMPVLELTTVGRKSGQPRTVLLTSPVRDGESIVVVASRGGDDRHPDWFLNLRANPAVEVSLRGAPKEPMTARVATAEERSRLWPQVTRRFRNYAAYQKKTAREIPLVLLDPRPAAGG